MRKALSVLLFLCLLAWQRPAASEAGDIETEDQGARYQFGQFIEFTLEATGDLELTDATLFFSEPTLPNTFTAEVRLKPSTSIRASYTVDLADVRLTPFGDVTYWWTVTDAEGSVTKLPEQVLRYEDDRFLWKSIARQGLVVHWAEGEASLGQAALDVVGQVTPGMQAIVPANLPAPLHIYLYPTASDLQAALRLTGLTWVGGHASPELGVLLIAVPDTLTAPIDLQAKLPHELSHVLLAAATGTAYDRLPVWFNEGLATYFELAPNPGYSSILASALATGDQIAFSELCATFPEESGASALAYAQSADMVQFIQDRYGNHTLTDMIRAFADGAGCESAVSRTLGTSLRELDEAWQRSRQEVPTWRRTLADNAIWLLLLGAGFLAALAMQVRPPATSRRKVRDG